MKDTFDKEEVIKIGNQQFEEGYSIALQHVKDYIHFILADYTVNKRTYTELHLALDTFVENRDSLYVCNSKGYKCGEIGFSPVKERSTFDEVLKELDLEEKE